MSPNTSNIPVRDNVLSVRPVFADLTARVNEKDCTGCVTDRVHYSNIAVLVADIALRQNKGFRDMYTSTNALEWYGLPRPLVLQAILMRQTSIEIYW